MIDRVDRRELLTRTGKLALAAGTMPWWRLLSSAAAVDPRVRALAHQLQGDVVGRGQAGYAAARRLYSTRFDGVRPLAVAYCENATDVAKAIHWSRKNGIRIAARSGGHSYAGYSTGQGLVIDVSRIDGVAVNAGRTQATVGAGARLIDVYDRLWAKQRTIPAGSCPSVGIAGLALGGGIGFCSRAFGTTSDNILGLRVVDAGGRVLDCDASHHADLYWASRGGGGGNFGVATSFRFKLHPVGTVTDVRGRMAVGAARTSSGGVAAMGAARSRRDLLGVQRLDGHGGTAGAGRRPVPRWQDRAATAARAAPRGDADPRRLDGADVHERCSDVGRLRRLGRRLPSPAGGEPAPRHLRGQVGLPDEAAHTGGDRCRAPRGRAAASLRRRRRRAVRLVRGCDQPGAEGGDGVRPPQRDLLAAGARLVGLAVCSGVESRLAEVIA